MNWRGRVDRGLAARLQLAQCDLHGELGRGAEPDDRRAHRGIVPA